MTASELYEIVREWPRGAWPEGATVNSVGGRAYWWVEYLNDEGKAVSRVPVSPSLAALLFEASGMRWLEVQSKRGVRSGFDEGAFYIEEFGICPGLETTIGRGVVKLDAIAEAIKATA